MSILGGFETGKSYTHIDVQSYFRFDTEQSAKNWIEDNHILYIPVNHGKIWTMLGEHILAAMAVSARSHADWRETRAKKRSRQVTTAESEASAAS